jgi:ppGpp synthetase/RelA/SpoT-type nucleotidyltranferase
MEKIKKNYCVAASKIHESITNLKCYYHKHYGCATKWSADTEKIFLLNCEIQIRAIAEKYSIELADDIFYARDIMDIETGVLFDYLVKYQKFPKENSSTVVVDSVNRVYSYLVGV